MERTTTREKETSTSHGEQIEKLLCDADESVDYNICTAEL